MSNPFQDIITNYRAGNSFNYSSSSSPSTSSIDIGDLFGFLKGMGSEAKRGDSDINDDDNDDDDDSVYEIDYKSGYEQMLKDFNSYKQRVKSSKEMERKNLLKELMNGFLDIIDYICVINNTKKANCTFNDDDKMLTKKLLSFLSTYDIKPMPDDTGKPFDIKFHDAVLADKTGIFESGRVAGVLSPGYMIGDEVLRHARVIVSID